MGRFGEQVRGETRERVPSLARHSADGISRRAASCAPEIRLTAARHRTPPAPSRPYALLNLCAVLDD